MSRPEARVEFPAAAEASSTRACIALLDSAPIGFIEVEVATPDGPALLMFRHRDRTP